MSEKSFISKSHISLVTVYISNVLLSFHYFLIIYVHSSYLGTYVNAQKVALLYTLGAVLNLIFFFNIPKILGRIGNYKFTLWAIILEGVAVAGLVVGSTPLVIGISFILHQAVISMILFGLDIFLEGSVKDEKKTGAIRGLYLTLSNITLVFSPFIAGLLLVNNKYWKVYAVSFVFLIPLFFIIKKYMRFASYAHTKSISILHIIKKTRADKNVRGVICAHFMLQFFYAWMVIYMPIYLFNHVGFSWKEIGVIFTVMLLPFMIFEFPVGAVADKKYGEKEIMILGFLLMILFTFFIPFLQTKNVLLWAILLFLTRVGASFVEATTESYFFKQVTDKDTGLISLFRMTRPLSYIVVPAIVVSVLAFLSMKNAPYEYMFAVLALFMLIGVRYSASLKDTR